MLYACYLAFVIATSGVICELLEKEVPLDGAGPGIFAPEIEKFCELNNVCYDGSVDPIAFQENRRPCCKSCSCRQDCEHSGDCCARNTSAPVETYQTECRPRSNFQSSGPRHPVAFRYYTFISGCPLDGDHYQTGEVNQTASTIPCGLTDVSPWGSFFPIYSKATRKLYKNNKCAECHGVKDGIPWSQQLHCISSSRRVSALLSSSLIDDHCYIVFNTPGDGGDLSHLECSNDVVNTCPDANFSPPNRLAKETIIRACVDGPLSPFYALFAVFANVYCYICNGGNLYGGHDYCVVDEFQTARDRDKVLTTIINTNVIEAQPEEGTSQNPDWFVCSKDNGEDCRISFCPGGQFRNKNGNCEHVTDLWELDLLKVVVELVPETTLDWLDIEQFTEHRFLANPSNIPNAIPRSFISSNGVDILQQPESSSWHVDELYINDQNENTSSGSFFVATLIYTPTSKSPAKILEDVRSWMTEKWTIQTNDTTYSVHQAMYKNTFPLSSLEDGTPLYVPHYVKHAQGNWKVDVPGYQTHVLRRVYRDNIHLRTTQKIWYFDNKLAFCHRVDLSDDEYGRHFDGHVLYLKRQDRFLEDAEFLNVRKHDRNIVQVCVEDLNMVMMSSFERMRSVLRDPSWSLLMTMYYFITA